MSDDQIFTAVRSSPAYLKPPPLPPGADAAAGGSFVFTLVVLAFGWITVMGITLALALNLQHTVSMLLFTLAVLANVAIAIVVGMLWRRYSRSTVEALPVIVTGKQHERTVYSETEGRGGERNCYWLTLRFEDGTLSDHGVSEELFAKVQPPCAGVAHLHSYEGLLVRYDAVLEKL